MTGDKITREITRVEGFSNPEVPVFWGQTKRVGQFPVRTDRNAGFKYPAVGKGKPKLKHSAAVQKALHDAAQKVIEAIQAIADGDVTSFQYLPPSQVVFYWQTLTVDKKEVQDATQTSDEKVLAAAREYAAFLVKTVVSKGKPLTVAEPEPSNG